MLLRFLFFVIFFVGCNAHSKDVIDQIIVDEAKLLINRGLNSNIGFEIAMKEKKKYNNIIFTDIDILPDSDLIEYYLKNGLNLNFLEMIVELIK